MPHLSTILSADEPSVAPFLRRYGPQEAGRSSGLPVHWPLWPAPLPPFVGGGGFPTADPIVAAKINPANMLAKTLRSESFTPHNHLSPRITAARRGQGERREASR
jgi:hypothetical protein